MTDLTDKWKKGELPDGFYWCDVDIYEDGNITKQIESFIHHHPVFYWETSIVRVIELAPSFSEYKSMQAQNTKLKEQLDDYERLADMRGEIIARMEDSDNDREKFQNKKIAKLKELLMSARNYLKSYRDLYSKDNEDIMDFIKEIDQVLADNQIQADTVACNKIQESE